MSALEQLVGLVPPPLQPTAASGDFGPIEADLGTALPSDYKALVGRYGYGTFSDFLHLWSPFFAACPMVAEARGALDADSQLAKVAPNAVPFAQFPAPDGVLPWARTDNGDVAYWLTWGAPDEWPVALWNPRAGQKYDLVEGGAAAFLLAWLSGSAKLRCPKPAFMSFDSWRERTHVTLKLSPPVGSFEARLGALLAAFAPTESRGGHGEDEDEQRQVHFVADGGACRVTYDTVYGHNVRLSAPPADLELARARIERAFASVGCILLP